MDFTILKTIRKSKKITLTELSDRIGVTPGYLSLVENNKRTPRVSTIEDICKELGGVQLALILIEIN